VVGVIDVTGEPLAVDLERDNLVIVGEPRTGRSTAAWVLAHQAATAGAEVWLVASPWSPAAAFEGAARTCLVEGPDRVAQLTEWAQEVIGQRPGQQVGQPRLLVVDDADLLGESDPLAAAQLDQLLGALRWVAVSSTPRGFNPNPVLQTLKQARSMVYLQPADRRDAHEVLGFNPPWHPGLPMTPGRGVVVVDRRPVLAQFSHPS
jgi:S-DNA-T family DNA segregation ATPase FtsK/SpoIIIE